MQYYRLSTNKEFSCIGAKCPDTCCAGWNIDVDKQTGDSYLKEGGEFGDKLRASIVPFSKQYRIKLDKDGRCPMLTDKNLCEIYQNLGKDKMCMVCKTYPRFIIAATENCSFAGYSLSCPEAAGRLLSQKEPAKISLYEKGENMPVSKEKQEHFDHLMAGLKLSLGILQYRKLSITERLRLLIFFNDMYEGCLKRGRNGEELLRTFSDVKQLESISASLKSMEKNPLKLTKFLLAVCHEILYFQGGGRLKRISDGIAGIICSCGAERFDLQGTLRHIRNKKYEIRFEQYLSYYLYFCYMNAMTDYDIMECVAEVVHMYCIHACFLAVLTEEKGSRLSFEEQIAVYTAAARALQHNKESKERLRKICEEEGFVKTEELLALL